METIVIDNGSYAMRAGFAGEEEPRSIIRSVVGRPKHAHLPIVFNPNEDVFYGDDAYNKYQILNLTYPIKNSVITNAKYFGNTYTSFDDMEGLWNQTFVTDLKITPSDRSVLLSECPFNPVETKSKTAQLFFEKFGVKSLSFKAQQILSLTSTGRHAGVVLDCGLSASWCVPIVDCECVKDSIVQTQVGGRHIDDYLVQLLKERSKYTYEDPLGRVTRDIKEKLSYVSTNDNVDEKSISKEYELPDKTSITIGKERYLCTQPLFDPALINIEGDGIPKSIDNAITKCDNDLLQMMYGNIVITGGSSYSFNGLMYKLQNELTKLAPPKIKILCQSDPNTSLMTWVGGALIACQSSFSNIEITKAMYNEFGVSLFTKK
uniref:Actin, putative n=1 Tax=Entamoeba invadens TaxID=33085 RepID=S0B7N1_ENTIV|nr:actin, putative [Entamoeba invadens]